MNRHGRSTWVRSSLMAGLVVAAWILLAGCGKACCSEVGAGGERSVVLTLCVSSASTGDGSSATCASETLAFDAVAN